MSSLHRRVFKKKNLLRGVLLLLNFFPTVIVSVVEIIINIRFFWTKNIMSKRMHASVAESLNLLRMTFISSYFIMSLYSNTNEVIRNILFKNGHITKGKNMKSVKSNWLLQLSRRCLLNKRFLHKKGSSKLSPSQGKKIILSFLFNSFPS